MAGQREPTDLVVYKGRKHLTKAEIEERKSQEIQAPNDKIKAPNYLSKSEKKEFNKISKELIKIGIMSNLDIDSLSFFIKTRTEYLRITKEVDVIDEDYERLFKMQLKALASCRRAAADLGLSIASRCRLVVPKGKDEKPKNKFAKFM